MNPLSSGLMAALLVHAAVASAQGNLQHQEKADVMFRALQFPLNLIDEHNGVFWEYTTGNPDDRNNSILIEMLGDPTNRIVINSVQNFINASTFFGAYGHLSGPISQDRRREIIRVIQEMRNLGRESNLTTPRESELISFVAQ